MIKSLVTGGAGFIGSHVSGELIKLGHEVIVMDDLSGGFRDNLPPGVTFEQGSVTDVAFVNSLFERYQFDYVYHLAAYAAEGLSHFIKRFNYENNLIGSMNLINASVNNKIKCFVFTSSIAVYGKGQVPLNEEMKPLPEDPYGISKLAVEMDLKCTFEIFGLPYIIFRPHNVYGEFQNLGDKYRNVVGIFINQLMEGTQLTIFGDGEQTRAFSYIGDIAPVIADSVNNKNAYNQIFNIGADQFFTVNQLANEICSAMNIQPNIRHLPARNEVAHAYADHQKALRIFGKGKNTSLSDGLNKMIAWAKLAGVRKSQKFSSIEITKNLPGIWME